MKVIKDNNDKGKPIETTCRDCNSILMVEFGDVTKIDDQREGTAYTFKCGSCGRKNWASDRKYERLVK